MVARSAMSVIVLVAVAAGCSSKSEPATTTYEPPPPLKVAGHPVLSALPDSKDLIIYEGLPHPEEATRLARELKEKKHFQLHGYPFYEEPLEVSAVDREKLVEILKTDDTFLAIQRLKLCGGFHPDYAVAWTVDGVEHSILLCFGCYDADFYKGDETFKYEIVGDSSNKSPLDVLLSAYRKNRPH
jgi:hypothetical protein